MKTRGLLMLLVLGAGAGCVAESRAASEKANAPEASIPGKQSGRAPWDLSRVTNLSRVHLSPAQRARLGEHGFFLSPLPEGKRARKVAERSVRAERATHLFHIYERNDYIRFPSFITVDLAIDTTHTYFDAVLRDLEEHHLRAILKDGLAALLNAAEGVRATATSPSAQASAARIERLWGVALHLLAPGAALPGAVKADVLRISRALEHGQAPAPGELLAIDLDASQLKPRSHYTRNAPLQRYFRAMSLLGMAAFPIEGEQEDVAGAALLARAYLGAGRGRVALARVLNITGFFAGGADAAGLDRAAAALSRVLPDAAQARADALVAPETVARFATELRATVSAARIAAPAREVRVLGRRAFEDAVALQGLIRPLERHATPANLATIVPATMGGLAAAAVAGSVEARDRLVAALPAEARSAFKEPLETARAHLARLPNERWAGDAYHGTLHALRALLEPMPGSVPPLLASPNWRLRALQAFAAGWTELRHDTLLYGEQLGAECDAEELEPPACWVEPVPRLYRRLAEIVRGLEKRLRESGLDLGKGLPPAARPVDDDRPDPAHFYQPPAEKTKLVLGLLDFLAETSELELQGRHLDRARLTRLTTLGGEVEWILMALADSDLLAERDADMAIVADVFTWRPSAQVLEVGIARPDLIFALIPSAKGTVLARGAIMSYREFLHPSNDRLTDEQWRTRLDNAGAPRRPGWLEPLYAEPVGPIRPPPVTQDRCGPMSGANIESL